MSAAIHARVLERRAAIARAKAEASNRDQFLDAARGPKGEKGDPGPAPAHEWKGSKLRFEHPDGSWGKWTDLRGKAGKDGKDGAVIVGGGKSGSFDPAALPELAGEALLSDYLILEREGVAYRVSISTLQAIFGQGGGLPANYVTINGQPMTIDGEQVIITE